MARYGTERSPRRFGGIGSFNRPSRSDVMTSPFENEEQEETMGFGPVDVPVSPPLPITPTQTPSDFFVESREERDTGVPYPSPVATAPVATAPVATAPVATAPATNVDALNTQITDLQTQLAEVNDRFNNATTQYEQSLADQQAQSLVAQQDALTTQRDSMLGEREQLLAEANLAAGEEISGIQQELQMQLDAKTQEITKLQSQITTLDNSIEAAAIKAEDYTLMGGGSGIGSMISEDANKQYEDLLSKREEWLNVLIQRQQELDALSSQAGTVLDNALATSQNRLRDYTQLLDTPILEDVTSTYVAPTDIYEDAALQRERESLANLSAQDLATGQYNAFSGLLGTPSAEFPEFDLSKQPVM